MEYHLVKVEKYQTSDGRFPFQDWLDSLKDIKGKAIVFARLARLEAGNYGDFKAIESIFELRIDYGPGYRVYCGKKEKRLVILLVGGSKKTQKGDIRKAKEYWEDYQKRSASKRPL